MHFKLRNRMPEHLKPAKNGAEALITSAPFLFSFILAFS